MPPPAAAPVKCHRGHASPDEPPRSRLLQRFPDVSACTQQMAVHPISHNPQTAQLPIYRMDQGREKDPRESSSESHRAGDNAYAVFT